MPTSCRVYPHESADGPANMALDEALLGAVAGDPGAAALRTYGWSVPTLSLGYFQRIAEAEADPRWRGAPIVRRPTGGGALWHDRELTYALVIPRGHPLAHGTRVLYRAVHEAIAALFRADGLGAVRRGAAPAPSGRENRPFLCFTDHDPDDIVSGDVKIVGSAQRRRSGAVLQHGSILLTRASLTPELAGAGDLAPIATDPTVWAARLRARLPEALGLDPDDSELPGAIRRDAWRLDRSVYRNPDWTRRR